MRSGCGAQLLSLFGEEPLERRLAAILVADVVGYSRPMGADEEGTLACLASGERVDLSSIVAINGRRSG